MSAQFDRQEDNFSLSDKQTVRCFTHHTDISLIVQVPKMNVDWIIHNIVVLMLFLSSDPYIFFNKILRTVDKTELQQC